MMGLASKSLEPRIKPAPEHCHIFAGRGAALKLLCAYQRKQHRFQCYGAACEDKLYRD
jgi:hypothetical protein